MNIDPRKTIDEAPMGLLQIAIIAITVGLNALDGFDVLSISFSASGIAKEWNITNAVLGLVMSMELIGMAVGSIALGGVADSYGRRKTMLWCLAAMALGMLMVGGSGNPLQTSLWRLGANAGILTNDANHGALYWLSFWRILTGLGIGGLLAAITAITAEFSSLKRRHLCISIMAIGYPIGGIIGGEIARRLLTNYDWRAIFYFGAAITTAFIPIFYLVVPESVYWLVRKQPAGALDKVNHTLKRLRHKIITALPEVSLEVRKKSFSDLFSPGLFSITTIITVAYFLQITTYYFILKWVPKVVVDMGFTAAEGANMLKYANIGGAIGGALLGLLTLRVDLKKLTMGTLALSAVFISILGWTPHDLRYIAFFVALSGFFGNSGIVGMYALFPVAFPTHVRASGAGFTVGVGRGGAILSPIMVGIMFQWGLSLPTVAMIISVGALIAAGVLIFLNLDKQQEIH